VKRRGDIAVASLHWGANWGYDIPREQVLFAHMLIDEAGVDVVHGHSSHHAKGIEVYKGKPIIYGCGDFLNDYEGIGGYNEFRDDLAVMYFVCMEAASGTLVALHMVPMQIKNFRLNRASKPDARWLGDMLSTQGSRFGTRVEMDEDNSMRLKWS
jgi:poly-gamma-glutamate synthesis protein (capsule biosynthesis protein)